MSKLPALSLLAALALAPAFAHAQNCPSGTTRVTGGTPANPNGPGNFTNFLSGARLCAARGGDRWQEFHQSGGQLFDWKRGLNDPVDPREQVGTWSAVNGTNATVTHTYAPGNAYTWAVCKDNSAATYTLVSLTAGTITGAQILSGEGACP